MIVDSWSNWLVTIILWMPTVNLEMPMQMLSMPSAYGFAGPVGAPMAIQIVGIQGAGKYSMTTTTTEIPEKTLGIVFPVAFPLPVQFAVPAYPPPSSCNKIPRPMNCPVCPPCSCTPCTPAFFSYCSPCHQKCRCQSARDTPLPIPRFAPVAMQSPAFPMPVPIPPVNSAGLPMVPVHSMRRQVNWGANMYEMSESESSESRSRLRRRTHGGKTRHLKRKKYRRHFSSEDDRVFATPVLSYIEDDGVVRMEQPLTDDEAAELMEENRVHKVQIVAQVDAEEGDKVKVISTNGFHSQDDEPPVEHRKRQLVLNSAQGQHVLRGGKKELVFNPPPDKKISNLSVSFQIS